MNRMFSAVVGLAALLVSGPAFSADEVARNRILLNTSLAQNSEPVAVYPGFAARALGPMMVECPQQTCTIEVSAWVTIVHSPDSELFWTILVLLDEGSPEQVTLSSGVGESFPNTSLNIGLDSRHIDVFRKGVSSGRHTVSVLVGADPNQAELARRSMTVNVYKP